MEPHPDGCGAHCQSRLTYLQSCGWGRVVVAVNLYLFKPQPLGFYSMQLNLICCKRYISHIIKNRSTLPLSLPFSLPPYTPQVPDFVPLFSFSPPTGEPSVGSAYHMRIGNPLPLNTGIQHLQALDSHFLSGVQDGSRALALHFRRIYLSEYSLLPFS